MRCVALFVLACTAAGLPALAEAEQPDQQSAEQEGRYPLRYAARPLTMPDRMIRLDGGIRLDNAADLDGALFFGGAISFANLIELGISPERLGTFSGTAVEGALPLKLFGDLDLGSVPLYLRFRIREKEKLDIAADLGVSVPLESSPDVSTFGAVLLRVRICDCLTLDTGVDVRITFANDAETTLTIPAILSWQLGDRLYAQLRTGVIAPELDGDRIAIPLGFEGGYTIGDANGPWADLLARFEWPGLLLPGAPGDKSLQDVWVLLGAMRFYIPI